MASFKEHINYQLVTILEHMRGEAAKEQYRQKKVYQNILYFYLRS